MNKVLRCLLIAASSAVLTACVGIPENLEPGQTRAAVLERLGTPTGEYPLADGTRLQYSRQPAGQQVYNVDLDAQGRLRRVEQVLDIQWMNRNIAIDRWTRDDVLRGMGQPARIEKVARFDGDIWTYRFLEMDIPRQAHIHIDPQGTVRRLVFTDEPRGFEPPFPF